MENRFDDIKERFHVVQLALFNAQVLSINQRAAEANPNGTSARLIDQCAKETVAAFPPAPSTINQSLFFGMAYLSIVWLSESLTLEQIAKASGGESISAIFSQAKVTGPRKLDNGAAFVKLMRNALSHGKVAIDDEFCFTFWDQNEAQLKGGGQKESDPTFLTLDSNVLAQLTMEYYNAVSCSIPDDHIDPRRSAFFMARSVLGDIREGNQC